MCCRKATRNWCQTGDISETSLVRLAQQTGVLASAAPTATKLLHLHPSKTTVVHTQYDTGRKARVNFASRYRHGIHEKKRTPHLFCLATNKASFPVSRYVKFLK